MRVKMSKQLPPAPTAGAVGPCPTLIQTSRTPRHWKFTQDHRTTRQPPFSNESPLKSLCGWLGGAMVLGKLPVPGRPTIWIRVRQGPTALAMCAGGGLFGHFYS